MIYHLAERRRFRPTGTFQEWLKLTLSKTTFLEAPFDFAVAAEVSQIHLPQPDLGDVFLAATAAAFDLTLVTADSQLLACKWLKNSFRGLERANLNSGAQGRLPAERSLHPGSFSSTLIARFDRRNEERIAAGRGDLQCTTLLKN